MCNSAQQRIVRFSENFGRWREIRLRSNATSIKLRKFKFANDRHLENHPIAIFQWNVIWFWWNFVFLADWDYNETNIIKTQKF